MLLIKSITLTDFGPFKGEQRIEFPVEPGVSIIYGENMRGKTTLLNAIRYALFGNILTRGVTQSSVHQIGNLETAQERKKFGFKVVLEFEHEGSQYQLTREHRPRNGIGTPESDSDYVQEVFLAKDTSVLGPNVRDAELARIMPETVSRFFLFDGELLQQYEELLRNESEMGHNIKEAIERILGLPVLTNGRADLAELAVDAQRREAKAAQKNQKTVSLGNQHEALLKQRDGSQAETDRLRGELEKLRSSKTAQEDTLKKSEKTKSLLDERGRLEDEIAEAEVRLKEKGDRRKELLTTAWKGLLNSRVRAARDEAETDLLETRSAYEASLLSEKMSAALREAVSHGHCATCKQELSPEARARITGLLSGEMAPADRKAMNEKIQHLQTRIAALKQSEATSNFDVLEEVQNSIDEINIKRATTADGLEELRDQTKDIDETETRRLYCEYDKTVTEIGMLTEGIKRQEDVVRDLTESIAKVEAEIAKFADADLVTERARKELCEGLRALFGEAVGAYRDRLRDKVGSDATSLFLQLTSEPEYKGLSINESYGLTIIHSDGSPVPVRSAGAEHIVALSLMGALQKNAPLRGPIVMDSPFGRLDETHTTKVVRALPSMADQVMLLVYENELDPEQARDELKGKLRKEYRITRRSARHSDIETIA